MSRRRGSSAIFSKRERRLVRSKTVWLLTVVSMLAGLLSGVSSVIGVGVAAGSFTPSLAGDIYTVAGTGTASDTYDNAQATDSGLSGPSAVAVDASGNIYIADKANNRVQEVPGSIQPSTTTLAYSGAVQTWTAPFDTAPTVTVTLSGAGGGGSPSGEAVGGTVTATVPVSPGEVLSVYVGGAGGAASGATAGAAGWGYHSGGAGGTGTSGEANGGGGGGGSSAVVASGTDLLEAGGGGGEGDTGVDYPGNGGNPNGAAAALTPANAGWYFTSNPAIGPAAGASQSQDGEGGSQSVGYNGQNSVGYGYESGTNYTGGAGGGGAGHFAGAGGSWDNYGYVFYGGSRWGEVYTYYSGSGGGGSSWASSSDSNISYSTAPTTANGSATITDARWLASNAYTLAGSAAGTAGLSGDGGMALSSELSAPGGVAVDGSGNVYTTDTANNRVQEIAAATHTQWGISMTAGDIYTVAGSSSGTAGHSGDGGVATSALLSGPTGIAVDKSGDVFIADNRVQEIAASSGDISTVAGSATGSSGTSGDGGLATSALLHSPVGLAVDPSRDLYIADTANNRVQETAASSGDISTVAGSATGSSGTSGDGGLATSALLSSPSGVALDSSGDLYIADSANNRVQEVVTTNHDVYTVAGSASGTAGYSGDGGPASSAFLHDPYGIALDAAGDLYIADSANNRLREVTSTSGPTAQAAVGNVYTMAGSSGAGYAYDGSQATSSELNYPQQVAIDAGGDVYIADDQNNRVQEVAATTHTQRGISMTAGDSYTVAGSATGAQGNSSSLLHSPEGVAVDAAGDLFIADTDNSRVQEVAASAHGQFGISMTAGDVYTVAGSATGGSSYGCPNSSASTSVDLDYPEGLAFDSSGDLYIVNTASGCVEEVAATAHNQWGASMAVGYIYDVAGGGSNSGTSSDGNPAASALLEGPSQVALDSSGDLYVVDTGDNRVQEVAAAGGTQWGQSMTAGDMYTVAGSASGTSGSSGDGGAAGSSLLTTPMGVAIDASNDVYVLDSGNYRVQEMSATTGAQWGQTMTTGDIYTVAGTTGSEGSSGDGGPGIFATFDWPMSLAADAAGDLYISDSASDVVRELFGYNNAVAGGGPTQPHETAGGTNPSEPNDPQPTFSSSNVRGTGLSVNAATGELDVNVVDFSIPGRGEPLDLAPTYSSTEATQETGPGPLGYGWTDSYAMEAVPDPVDGPSVMDIVQENGSVVRFAETATGTWAAPARVQATLTQQGGNWIFNRAGTEIFTFNPAGQLISESDLNGYTTTLSYNSSGQLTTVTDPVGRTLSFTYNSNGFVWYVTDPAGRTTTYGYANGDLTSVTDVGSGVTDYAYNSANQLTSVTEPLSPTPPATVLQYNSAGQVTSETDPLGRQTQWLYALDPTNSGAVTITDARGYQTQEVLSDGEPTSITNAYGTSDATTTTYGYFSGTDGTSSVTTAAGTPYAETTTYTYNTPGDLLSKSAPAPSSTGTWTWSYNSLNEVTSSQTPLQAAAGVSAQLTYDSNGNLKSTSVPLPTNGTDTPSSTYATTTYNYGTGCSIAGANGCYTGDVQSIVSPLGNVSGANAANYTTNYTYDSYGDQTSVTDPLGNKATDVYNDIGELLCTVSAKETALGVSCPTAGSWVSGATAYTYDNYGDLLSETNPAGYESSATYDDIGDQLTYTDAMSPSNTTDFKFDNDGEPTQTTYPDGTTTSTTYDPDGDVLTTTDKGATSPLTPTRLWTRSPRCKQPSRPS